MPSSSLSPEARRFERIYLDQLLTVELAEVRHSPCLGYGRGGVAYSLLHAALAVSGARREQRLERASVWAAAGIRTARAFEMPGWPKASFSRGLSGLHAITAMIAAARGDTRARDRAIERYLAVNQRARGSIDLFSGAAGRLAGTSVFYRACPDPRLLVLGNRLARRLLTAVTDRSTSLPPVGIAHGWPGVLLALLEWDRVARSTDHDVLRDHLRALHDTYALGCMGGGWAHGDGGMAMLWSRAWQQLGDSAFLTWAREAGDFAYRSAISSDHANISLMSGAPGTAYCLVPLIEADARGPWKSCIEMLLRRTLADLQVPDENPYGVWNGLSGMFCLINDLKHPTNAGFPGIEG